LGRAPILSLERRKIAPHSLVTLCVELRRVAKSEQVKACPQLLPKDQAKQCAHSLVGNRGRARMPPTQHTGLLLLCLLVSRREHAIERESGAPKSHHRPAATKTTKTTKTKTSTRTPSLSRLGRPLPAPEKQRRSETATCKHNNKLGVCFWSRLFGGRWRWKLAGWLAKRRKWAAAACLCDTDCLCSCGSPNTQLSQSSLSQAETKSQEAKRKSDSSWRANNK